MKTPIKPRTNKPAESASHCIFPVFSETSPEIPSKKALNARFKPGQSGNPKGRPKGALNKSTLAARAILEHNATRLMAKAVEMAIEGSPIALKLCVERLVSIPQDRPVTLDLPTKPSAKSQPGTPASTFAKTGHIFQSHSAVLRAVASGDITPNEGQSISTIVEAHRRSWESVELAERITALENRADDNRRNRTPRVIWQEDDAPLTNDSGEDAQ